MAAQIDSSPGKIMPDNQPLIYTISDSGTTPDRFIVQVEEGGTEIAKLYLTPNTNNKSHFDLSDVVRDRVKVDWKIRDESAEIFSYKTKAFTTGRNGLRKYTVKVGRFNGGTETLNQANADIYLVDGAEQTSAGLHPSFGDYYASGITKKVWLTDRIPDASGEIHVEASDECEGVMCFLNDDTILTSNTLNNIRMVLTIEAGTTPGIITTTINTTNGAQAPSDASIPQKWTAMGVFPANLNGWGTASQVPSNHPTWTNLAFQPRASSGTSGMKLIVNKKCRPNKHDATQMAWTNSRGGWDYVLFTGRTEHEDSASSKPYKKTIGDYDAATFSFLPEAREQTDYQKEVKTKYTLRRVDFSFADIHLLKFAIRSDNVFIRRGTGSWEPVILDTKSVNVKEAFSGMFSVSLKATLAQTVKC
jgi:hypothetical protein